MTGVALLRGKLVEYYQLGKPMSFPENALSALIYALRKNSDFDVTNEDVLRLTYMLYMLGPHG